ncbi:MAG: D-glycerate dehydrogenase [Chloroflexi bacterium]|nr:D-glycerate dehydrogenase [Chloroflexota bacterium]MDA1219968.1 D-glycerate dehydrogenase [Chloroflexota bacterium]
MPKLPVLVTRQILPEALELLSEATDVEVWPDEYPPSPEKLRELLADKAGALINIMDRLDGPTMAAAPNLKVISQLGVGVDHIDVAEATRRGILVGNTPGVLAKCTADLAFALLMCAARRVSESDRWVRNQKWQLAFHPLGWLGVDVHNSTLGIIGMGEIGQQMVRRAHGFDMKVVYFSRTRKPELEEQYGIEYADLPTLLSRSDFVSLHFPLTLETRHFIGEAELRMMKPNSILINTARGGVLDSNALYTALKEGWIYAAGLDVTDPEPIATDDPLLTLDNIIITPHVGSAAIPTRRDTMFLAIRNLVAGLNGKRLEACANPELYQKLGM